MFTEAEKEITAAANAIVGLQKQIEQLEKRVAEGEAAHNIEGFGCKTLKDDPDLDNGAILSKKLDGYKNLKYPIQVPGDLYGVKSTVLIPTNLSGLSIKGTGRSQYSEYEAVYGTQSRFIWTGNEAKPIIELQSACSNIDGLMLIGRRKNAEVRASHGIRVSKGATIGTGKITSPQLTVAECDIGIEFVGPQNCDQSTFGYLVLDRCGVGVKNTATQCLQNRVEQAWVRKCDIGFEVVGGQFSIGRACVLSGVKTFIKLGNSDGWLSHQFDNIMVDKPHVGVILDAMEMSRPALVTFNNFYAGGSSTEPVFKLAKHLTLVLNRAQRLRAGMIECHGTDKRRTKVLITQSKFLPNIHPSQVVDLERSVGPWTCSWRDCFGYYNEPIEDGEITETGNN